MLSIPLLQAPAGYMPNVDTDHDHANNVMSQTFKGGRVHFFYYVDGANASAFVDGEKVGAWEAVTVDLWGDILYSLEQNFSNLIEN